MASWEDVRRLALALPETSERSARQTRQWRVREKLFVWERPLRPGELQALEGEAPRGPILAAKVEHIVAKEALLAEAPSRYFTTPHFDGYPAVLARLSAISVRELDELVTEAWLAAAPKRLAAAHLAPGLGEVVRRAPASG